MIEIPNLHPATRYHLPSGADQLLFERESFVVGYSFLARQPRFAAWLLREGATDDETERQNSFREDNRVPDMFRSKLMDYEQNSETYDRGHIVASADVSANDVLNSNTFLLSNMSPQLCGFNRGIWKSLESDTRKLSREYAEVYVLAGCGFTFGKPIELCGSIPVPHFYWKSVLAESTAGAQKLWNFLIPHEVTDKPLDKFLVPCETIETFVGLSLWNRLAERPKGGKSWPIGKKK